MWVVCSLASVCTVFALSGGKGGRAGRRNTKRVRSRGLATCITLGLVKPMSVSWLMHSSEGSNFGFAGALGFTSFSGFFLLVYLGGDDESGSGGRW